MIIHSCHTHFHTQECNCVWHLLVRSQRNPETCKCFPIPLKSHMQDSEASWSDARENSSILLLLNGFYSIHKKRHQNFIGLCAESFIE